VSILIDGKVVTDSGPLAVREIEAERTFRTDDGEHTVQLRAEVAGGPDGVWRTKVRCGREEEPGERA